MDLLAACDAKYQFTLIDIGHCGSNNNSGILSNCSIGSKFAKGEINLPNPATLNGCAYNPLPYFTVGDEIFPLKTWLMRPCPDRLEEKQRVFHYRLSRSSRVVENAFDNKRYYEVFKMKTKALLKIFETKNL